MHETIRAIKTQHQPAVHGLDDVKFILSCITFAPSCVDMGWEWEVESVSSTMYDGTERLRGYALRTTFRRPERESGEISIGYGRWWIVPQDVTVSGVVKTAFAAAKMILEHEVMESFKWQGKRVFDPHNSVELLAHLQDDIVETLPAPMPDKVYVKRRINMSFIEWCKIIVMSAFTIGLLMLIFYGAQQAMHIFFMTGNSLNQGVK
jgi:hypothetical protein